MRRGLVIRVSLCPILGVALSIGNAWASAIVGERMPGSAGPRMRLVTEAEPAESMSAWFVTRYHGFGHQVYRFQHGSTFVGILPGSDSWPLNGPLVSPDVLPSWSEVPASGIFVETHGYGWPRLALTGWHSWFGESGTFMVIKGGCAQSDEVWLPVRPIWAGLVVDTAAMGAACWLALFMPGIARRRFRFRRGRCPECGYDLLGKLVEGCPECGWGRD